MFSDSFLLFGNSRPPVRTTVLQILASQSRWEFLVTITSALMGSLIYPRESNAEKS